MNRRVTALETAVLSVGIKIDALTASIAAVDKSVAVIDAKLDAKASSAALAKIEGQLSHMPTKWFVGRTAVGVMFGAAGLLSAVLVYLEKLRALLGAH